MRPNRQGSAGSIRLTIAGKLEPGRFTAMSPKMAAIVSYVLAPYASWTTEPEITGLHATEGAVLADLSDGRLYQVVGSVEDFDRNWGALIAAAGLTSDEIVQMHRLLDNRICTCTAELGHPHGHRGPAPDGRYEAEHSTFVYEVGDHTTAPAKPVAALLSDAGIEGLYELTRALIEESDFDVGDVAHYLRARLTPLVVAVTEEFRPGGGLSGPVSLTPFPLLPSGSQWDGDAGGGDGGLDA